MKKALLVSLAALAFCGAVFFVPSRNEAQPPTTNPARSPASFSEAPSEAAGVDSRSSAADSALAAAAATNDAPAADLPLLTGRAEKLTPTASGGTAALPGHPATERVYLQANDIVLIPLNRAALRRDSGVLLRADHGGVLDGRSRSPQVELTADATSFTFQVGAHRGLYTVSITQGHQTETLEFWVGEKTPAGRAGPARSVIPPAHLVADTRS